MINWILEEVEVEDVACTVNDMDGTYRSRTLVQREWSEGRVERGHKGWEPQQSDACKETITASCGLGSPIMQHRLIESYSLSCSCPLHRCLGDGSRLSFLFWSGTFLLQ